MDKINKKILFIIFLFFLFLFGFKSLQNMVFTPFNSFDEAHRAENAKRMRQYQSYLVPLTGSSFDRIMDLRIPAKDNPHAFLYYHLERPSLVYLSMVVSTSLFGEKEWAYRLPSFVLGMLVIFTFVYFAKKNNTDHAFWLGILALITSGGLWLSSQYAQLDTGLTLFLFLSLLSLITYVENRKTLFLALTGFSFALAVLSKGQAAIILIFPLIFLVLAKKLTWQEVLKLAGFAGLLLIPWMLAVVYQFGLIKFLQVFSHFAFFSATIDYLHHQAPIFWYVRFFWDDFRPGWTLFLIFLVYDLIQKKIDVSRLILLSFILPSLVVFSLPSNKLWWYVLPLVPAICYYIFLSLSSYLKTHKKITNLGLVIILASLPVFIGSSNREMMLYGLLITFSSYLIMFGCDFRILAKFSQTIFIVSLVTALVIFYLNFPKIVPYHWETRDVAGYFAKLPGQKCLWIKDIPSEAVLYYSDAVEVYELNEGSQLFWHCDNYLLTTSGLRDTKWQSVNYKKLLLRKGELRLFQLFHQTQ